MGCLNFSSHNLFLKGYPPLPYFEQLLRFSQIISEQGYLSLTLEEVSTKEHFCKVSKLSLGYSVSALKEGHVCIE